MHNRLCDKFNEVAMRGNMISRWSGVMCVDSCVSRNPEAFYF